MINKIKKIYIKYLDYFLCISFLSLIIIKINNIFFQISFIYLYIIIILLTILFLKQWILLTNKIKNTYIFNFFLYYFLTIKNNLYGLTFSFFNYAEHEKYEKLIVFLTAFILSNWILTFFWMISSYNYNLTLISFFVLLLFSIFNLIESKIIFAPENIKKEKELDFILVQQLLKIENQTFKKNKSFFYIQKRYIHLGEIKNLIKRHGITFLTGTSAGGLLTGYLQHSSVQVQKDELNFQKLKWKEEVDLKQKELDLKQKELDFQKLKWKEEVDLKQKELEVQKLKWKEEFNSIDNID